MLIVLRSQSKSDMMADSFGIPLEGDLITTSIDFSQQGKFFTRGSFGLVVKRQFIGQERDRREPDAFVFSILLNNVVTLGLRGSQISLM